MKRFVKEYANYKVREWRENDLMRQEYKDKCADLLSKYLRAHEAGLISVDECMDKIVHIESVACDELNAQW